MPSDFPPKTAVFAAESSSYLLKSFLCKGERCFDSRTWASILFSSASSQACHRQVMASMSLGHSSRSVGRKRREHLISNVVDVAEIGLHAVYQPSTNKTRWRLQEGSRREIPVDRFLLLGWIHAIRQRFGIYNILYSLVRSGRQVTEIFLIKYREIRLLLHFFEKIISKPYKAETSFYHLKAKDYNSYLWRYDGLSIAENCSSGR